MFKKATKLESKLRMAIAGPSGSGKTYTALKIAEGLKNGGRIAVIDTERGSASKYSDLFDFDVCEIGTNPKDPAPFHPDRYITAIHEADKAGGYDVIVIDSISHAWKKKGGVLEIVDQAAKKMKIPNSYTAWNEGTPVHDSLIDAILNSSCHIITTMRSKQDYVQDKNEQGRTIIRKVGMAPIQRDDIEYEFDVFGEMDRDHNMITSKTRIPELDERVFAKPGTDVSEIVLEWLKGKKNTEVCCICNKNLRNSYATVDGKQIPLAEYSQKKLGAMYCDECGKLKAEELKEKKRQEEATKETAKPASNNVVDFGKKLTPAQETALANKLYDQLHPEPESNVS